MAGQCADIAGMPTAEENERFLPTRSSLLSRLRHASDREGWRFFMENHGRLIFQVCLRAGLTRQEAEDVAQETVTAVARQMPRFQYDRTRGSFKGWLSQIARHHIADFFGRKMREAQRTVNLPAAQAEAAGALQTHGVDGGALDDVWESEWRQHLLSRALRCAQAKLPARSVQIFQLSVIDGWSAEKIATALCLSRPQVYLARHRAARLVKREVDRLKRELE